MPEPYDPQAFWDYTLGGDHSIGRIAYPSFPESLNRHLYRSMKDVVSRVLKSEGLTDLSSQAVLDVGSGVGTWIDYWRQHGAGRVVGLDITSAGFERLRERFPGSEFVRADIGDPELPLTGRFQLVSAMNVLLHITDDGRWTQAIANLARVLDRDGVLLVIDPIVFKHEHRGAGEPPTESLRPIEQWRDVLRVNGLAIARVEPATVLLATPVDAATDAGFAALWLYWRAVMKVAGRRERVGELLGGPLQLLDGLLTRALATGPASKCMLIRRVA